MCAVGHHPRLAAFGKCGFAKAARGLALVHWLCYVLIYYQSIVAIKILSRANKLLNLIEKMKFYGSTLYKLRILVSSSAYSFLKFCENLQLYAAKPIVSNI